MEGKVSCGKCTNRRLISLPDFIPFASLHVRFKAVNITEGLCGLKNDCAGVNTDFASLREVNGELLGRTTIGSFACHVQSHIP